MDSDDILVAEVVVNSNKKLNKLKELKKQVKAGNFEKILALENMLKEVRGSEPEYKERNNMFLLDTILINREHYLAGSVVDDGLSYLSETLNCTLYESLHEGDPNILNTKDNLPFIIAEQLEEDNFYSANFTAINNGELVAYGIGTDTPPTHKLRFLGRESFINKIIEILNEDKELKKVNTELNLVDESYSEIFERLNYKVEYNRKDGNKITFIEKKVIR